MNQRRRWAAGALAAVLMTVAGLMEAGSSNDAVLDWHSVTAAVWLGACVLAATALPLTSLLALQLAVLLPVLLWDTRGPGGALLIGMLLLVGHLAYRRALRPALVGYVASVVAPSLVLVAQDEGSWEFMFFALILGSGFLVGVLLRREQQRSAELGRLARELATERELRARDAVDEERARISRELHDAVAHNLSVMTLQIGVVRRRVASAYPEADVELETLAAAEDLGRASVDELRRVVGLIRPDSDGTLAPRPSLERVPDLAETMRTAGLPVDVVVEGTPVDLPAAVDMSVFRVVQEALTNTLRHAGDRARATVRLTWRPDELELEVSDDGSGPVTGPRPSSDHSGADRVGGHGLLGMRERVELFGGRLETGPGEHGGFRVLAHLPVARRGASRATASAP